MFARVSAILFSAALGMIVYTIPVTAAHADTVSCADAQVALTSAVTAEQAANMEFVNAQAALNDSSWWNRDAAARRLGIASYGELVAQSIVRQARTTADTACGSTVVVTPAPPPIVVAPTPVDAGLGVGLNLHL